jgi:hypothetical protein
MTSLDLSFFAGRVIQVRFYFHTLGATVESYPGWFFDNVLISQQTPGWILVAPSDGTLSAGEVVDLDIYLYPTGLPPGSYDSNIVFLSNDPDESRLVVPVRTNMMAASAVAATAVPAKFDVARVTPNPGRGLVTIAFELPRAQVVRGVVYDILGRRVRTLASGPREAGKWQLQWRGEGDDGVRRGAGVYLFRLEAPDGQRTQRFVWIP